MGYTGKAGRRKERAASSSRDDRQGKWQRAVRLLRSPIGRKRVSLAVHGPQRRGRAPPYAWSLHVQYASKGLIPRGAHKKL